MSLRLRTKFLLAFTAITAGIAAAVLLIVQYRVRVHVREEIARALSDSVVTFQSFQRQRDLALERSTALMATLPPLKAVMTSEDPATIQDASTPFWQLVGSQIFVLADRSGRLVGLHTSVAGIALPDAETALARDLRSGESHDWWFVGGHLFQVFLEPIYFGPPQAGRTIGVLAVGYETDVTVAADVTRVASAGVGFGYEHRLVISTVSDEHRGALADYVGGVAGTDTSPREITLGGERFLATSVRLSPPDSPLVTLTLLKSYDQATLFLRSLNRWIVVIGVVGVLAGALLVFLVSTTFTRPLRRLLSAVLALERGDFTYPLEVRGGDEVSAVSSTFVKMRRTLGEAQRKLLEAEQLATIGRLASTISHDLRHPLTAILAYAEFLSEFGLTEAQRKDFFQEIRIAVNRMMDEINSLLGFSKQGEVVRPAYGRMDVVVERAVRMVKALPEYESIVIAVHDPHECAGWFDASKFERAMMNLLLNAAQAVSPENGRIDIECRRNDAGIEIRVADNGPGISETIGDTLFQPFVSHGKEQGIGLGLTVVQNIMQQHNGDVSVERTGPEGTVFRLFFPVAAEEPARAAVPNLLN